MVAGSWGGCSRARQELPSPGSPALPGPMQPLRTPAPPPGKAAPASNAMINLQSAKQQFIQVFSTQLLSNWYSPTEHKRLIIHDPLTHCFSVSLIKVSVVIK